MPLVVVPPYAVALAAVFLALSIRVILARRAANLGFGVGDAAAGGDLERRVRSHANFAEYVPFALLLLAMAELDGAPAPWLHALCAILLAGRLAHALGLATPRGDEFGRIAGMTGTQTAILGAAVLLATRIFR